VTESRSKAGEQTNRKRETFTENKVVFHIEVARRFQRFPELAWLLRALQYKITTQVTFTGDSPKQMIFSFPSSFDKTFIGLSGK